MPDERTCPQCHQLMTFHKVEDLPLAICGLCGGVWYDAGLFDKMVKEGPTVADEVEALEPPLVNHVEGQSAGKCPICQIPLHPHRYGGAPDIFVGGCYQCGGIFIDADSFKKLEAREHQYPDPTNAPNLDPEVREAAATLDALRVADMYKVQLAQYRWNSLTRQMPWYYGI